MQTKTTKIVIFLNVCFVLVFCVFMCCFVCVFLYGPFCHGALKYVNIVYNILSLNINSIYTSITSFKLKSTMLTIK